MELATTFLGIIYITIPSILLVFLAFSFPYGGVYNRYTILGLFFMVWANDSGAYITGKLLGSMPYLIPEDFCPDTVEYWIGLIHF